MPREILYRETHGDDESEVVFIKSEDRLSVARVDPGLTVAKSYVSALCSFVKEVFLPQGFPESVHPDYVPYQIWDTIQAFASTIMGTLTTHSIMRGVGVGESSATPLAAAITWILKDGTGMVGRIVFAWWNGAGLDAQCKKWRLFADVLNDLAMGIELAIPYVAPYSTLVLCASTAMKAVVGVAGGATRATLTQHQALQNNLADVSAKDGSQETFVNLVASFVGIFILSHLHDGRYVMELYLFLVAVHLYANYSAVKALCLDTLNEDRLALIVRDYLVTRGVPRPEVINKNESVLLFQNPSKNTFGFHIKLGVSLRDAFERNVIDADDMRLFSNAYKDGKYLIITDLERKTILITLSKHAQSADILKAYFHACLYALITCITLKWPIDILAKAKTNAPSYPLMRLYLLSKKYLSTSNKSLSRASIELNRATDEILSEEYALFLNTSKASGWTTETTLLPIGSWRGSWT